MAATKEELFKQQSKENALDVRRQEILRKNLQEYKADFEEVKPFFSDLENSKKKAHLTKWKVTENLERYLVNFESNFIKNGGRVLWANDKQEALDEIDKLLKTVEATSIVKSHAMVFEEIDLERHLKTQNISIKEADIGRYINSLEQAIPSHVIQPSIHLSHTEIADLFHKKHQTALDATAEEIVAFHTKQFSSLRQHVFLSGASHLIADKGTVVLNDNEGLYNWAIATAKMQIILVGIDKILPSWNDLDLHLSLSASHDYAQRIHAHHTLLNGPRRQNEIDGPKDIIVILIDNGRSNILAEKDHRQALYAMECGASSNHCNVYENIGGRSYQITYPGPMGAAFTPHLPGAFDEHQYLTNTVAFSPEHKYSNALHVDIDRLILLNRKKYVDHNKINTEHKNIQNQLHRVAQNKKWFDLLNPKIKNFFFRFFFKKFWGKQRELPQIHEKPFSKQYNR